MNKLILVTIFSLAVLLRVVNLATYPTGFTADEASHGYDAYSLLLTGKDQWGESWPWVFRSFGDFKLPLYSYIDILPVSVLGLNILSTRLPGAILGSLSILVVYFLSTALLKDKRVGLLAAFLLAISPWHIMLSRGAFEANLTSFFLPLAVLLFIKGLENSKIMVLSAFAFGLNIFSYHSPRYFTPLLILILFWFYRKELRKLITDLSTSTILAATIFIAFLGLTLYTTFTGSASRGLDIIITNPTDKWASVADSRYEAILLGLPAQVARLFSNKVIYVQEQFLNAYFSYLSPQYLFTNGVSDMSYGMVPGHGVLYLLELPFLIGAMVLLTKRKATRGLKFIIIWILLSILPAALTKGAGYAGNRSATMMPAIQIFAAAGGVYLFDIVNKRLKRPKLLFATVFLYTTLFLASLIVFLEHYVYHAPIIAASSMRYGTEETINYLKTVESAYEKIHLSRSLSEPQIYVLFYRVSNTPSDKEKMLTYQGLTGDWLRYEKEGKPFLDQLGEYSLGKYVFGGVDYSNEPNGFKSLYVGKPEDFPSEVIPLRVVKYPGGEDAIYIVEHE